MEKNIKKDIDDFRVPIELFARISVSRVLFQRLVVFALYLMPLLPHFRIQDRPCTRITRDCANKIGHIFSVVCSPPPTTLSMCTDQMSRKCFDYYLET